MVSSDSPLPLHVIFLPCIYSVLCIYLFILCLALPEIEPHVGREFPVLSNLYPQPLRMVPGTSYVNPQFFLENEQGTDLGEKVPGFVLDVLSLRCLLTVQKKYLYGLQLSGNSWPADRD